MKTKVMVLLVLTLGLVGCTQVEAETPEQTMPFTQTQVSGDIFEGVVTLEWETKESGQCETVYFDSLESVITCIEWSVEQ